MLAAGSHARNARGLRMKNGRSHAHQRGRQKNGGVARSHRQGKQSDQRDAHSRRKKIRLGMAIAIKTDERLQQRGSKRGSKGDDSDLAVIQAERIAKHGIDTRQKRLHRVIEQVTEADGQQNLEDCPITGH